LAVDYNRKIMRRQLLVFTLIILAVLVLGAVTIGPRAARKLASLQPSGMSQVSLGLGTFPAIDTSKLAPTQRRIVEVAKVEHATQPDYTKYSEGNKEAWCSDFLTWTLKQAGAPLTNPNSSGWRIPGTVTLKEYFVAKGTFHPLGDAYVPKTGDVVVYDGAGWFGQHTNFVLQNKDGQLTTIGGNENGKVRVQTKPVATKGTVGYAEI